MNRQFDDLDGGFWCTPFRRSTFDLEPFFRREIEWSTTPAVDVSETDKACEVTAELPGMAEKDIEVALANGTLTIKAKARRKGREAEGLLFERTPLWLLRAPL